LRIACKKLRYSTELFASLYAANRTKDYLAALAKLQDILGKMNDIAVARRLLDELDAAREHEAIALVREQLERDYLKCIKKFNQGWRKLFAQRKFRG
jgi:CHAD domain-containing protein